MPGEVNKNKQKTARRVWAFLAEIFDQSHEDSAMNNLKLVQIKDLAQQTVNTTNPEIIDANQKLIGELVDQISADIDNLILTVEQVSQGLKAQLEQ